MGEMEREVQMNVDANGRKRLEAMKRALAAGVPLAGLLAGMACATEAVAGDGFRTMGKPMPVERRIMGVLAPSEAVVRPKTMEEEEERAKDPKGAEIPGGAEKQEQSAGEGEEATGSRE